MIFILTIGMVLRKIRRNLFLVYYEISCLAGMLPILMGYCSITQFPFLIIYFIKVA